MTEHTADLRREEIAREADGLFVRRLSPLSAEEEAAWRERAIRLRDIGAMRLILTLDATRSQDTATARIADLTDALDGVTDVADHFIRRYGLANTSGEKHAVRKAGRNAALNVIALARAVLSGETRTDGAGIDVERLARAIRQTGRFVDGPGDEPDFVTDLANDIAEEYGR